jgi:hypothetical protein
MRIVLELAYWQAVLRALGKSEIPITPYIPVNRRAPLRRLDVVSAWEGIQNILSDIIERFHLNTERCLEFGVEFGFSTVALSNYFESVTGVDTFAGDIHTTNKQDIYQETMDRLAPYTNIELIRSDYKDFIKREHARYGLIHVDIIHTFTDTFACGLWSAEHSQCTIFHDTESFPEVRQAVLEIARVTGKQFYNFKESFGLGILV